MNKDPLPPATRTLAAGPCRGPRTNGPAVEGVGEFVDRADWPAALAALRRTYGLRFQLGYVTDRLWTRLTKPATERHAILRIRPA